MSIQIGQYAPDFTLNSHLDREYRLSEFRGHKNVVLVFFPWAWTPV